MKCYNPNDEFRPIDPNMPATSCNVQCYHCGDYHYSSECPEHVCEDCGDFKDELLDGFCQDCAEQRVCPVCKGDKDKNDTVCEGCEDWLCDACGDVMFSSITTWCDKCQMERVK